MKENYSEKDSILCPLSSLSVSLKKIVKKGSSDFGHKVLMGWAGRSYFSMDKTDQMR